MSILVLNVGSSSLKVSIYDFETLRLISSRTLEKLPSISFNDQLLKLSTTEFLNRTNVTAIGCRVVHGGPNLRNPTIVDSKSLQTIRDFSTLAPIHNPIAADLIESSQKIFPGVPVVAVFDTAFHQTLPPIASTYAIPHELASKFGLSRYGFHGIAHQYVSHRLQETLGSKTPSVRLINCHLGSGASICAIKNGQSLDTSMGFTPMEGLIMGSRSGDIDPGIIFHLLHNSLISVDELHSLLNSQCGLLGISGISSDVRELEQAAHLGNKQAELALQCFAYRVIKYIGSYIAVLGGIDALSFSGGIGENSASIRSRICDQLSYFGISLDSDKNHKAKGKSTELISNSESTPSVWVIHADEALQIAEDTRVVVTS